MVIWREDFDSIELMEVIQHSFDYDKLENPMGIRRRDALLNPASGGSHSLPA